MLIYSHLELTIINMINHQKLQEDYILYPITPEEYIIILEFREKQQKTSSPESNIQISKVINMLGFGKNQKNIQKIQEESVAQININHYHYIPIQPQKNSNALVKIQDNSQSNSPLQKQSVPTEHPTQMNNEKSINIHKSIINKGSQRRRKFVDNIKLLKNDVHREYSDKSTDDTIKKQENVQSGKISQELNNKIFKLSVQERKDMLKVAEQIQSIFYKHNFSNILDSLSRYLGEYQPQNNNVKKDKNKPIYPTIHLQKRKPFSQLADYSYLKIQQLPPPILQLIPKYGVNGSCFYDMVIQQKEEWTKEEQLRFLQQRFLAEIFCTKGYGISYFRQAINDNQYILQKDRYKSVVGTMIRLGFRSIQQFLQIKMKRNISALRRIQVKALLTPLLNIKTEFTQAQCEIFYRCLRTTFRLKTELAFDVEVLDFYKAVVIKARGQQYAKIIDRRLSIQEQNRIDTKIYQSTTLWTSQLQNYFVQMYLKKQSLSGIKEQFQKKYCPPIHPHHFDNSRIRARCDKIFTNSMKKVNHLLDLQGHYDVIIPLTDRLKKIISRSPIAAEIRIDLCNIFLNKIPHKNYVLEIVTKITKMIDQNNSLFKEINQDQNKIKIQNMQSESLSPGQNISTQQNYIKLKSGKRLQKNIKIPSKNRRKQSSPKQLQQLSEQQQSLSDQSASQKMPKLKEQYLQGVVQIDKTASTKNKIEIKIQQYNKRKQQKKGKENDSNCCIYLTFIYFLFQNQPNKLGIKGSI